MSEKEMRRLITTVGLCADGLTTPATLRRMIELSAYPKNP